MNKKDKEQAELNRLLQECIREQKDVGLCPIDNIEIYFNKDPITGEKCDRNSYGFSAIDKSDRKFIIISKKYFDKMPIKQIKRLIHHELIHLNLNKDGKMLSHHKDWKEISRLSKVIYDNYNINPLGGYGISCFENKSSEPNYNYSSVCKRCGLETYYVLNEGFEYDFDGRCPNCGARLEYKKRPA